MATESYLELNQPRGDRHSQHLSLLAGTDSADMTETARTDREFPASALNWDEWFRIGYNQGIDPFRQGVMEEIVHAASDEGRYDDIPGYRQYAEAAHRYSQILESGDPFGIGLLARVEYELACDPAQWDLVNTTSEVTVEGLEAECSEADLVLGSWMRERGIAGWETVLEGTTKSN